MAVKVREKPEGSGIWWIFIDHRGKRKAKKVGKDKRLAQEMAKKIEAKLALGDAGLLEKEEPKVSTFGEYAQTWIVVTVPATCKSSTQIDYKSILDNHVLPAFGKTPVNEISRAAIKQFLMEKIKAGLAASTVGHMKSVLSGVLGISVDDEAIQSNPAQRLGKIFRAKNIKDEINPLTREELFLPSALSRNDPHMLSRIDPPSVLFNRAQVLTLLCLQ